MPVSFQGGQPVPAVGTAAYNAAQQGSGMGSFNPASGVLSINGAPIIPSATFGQAVGNPPSVSASATPTVSLPAGQSVVTQPSTNPVLGNPANQPYVPQTNDNAASIASQYAVTPGALISANPNAFNADGTIKPGFNLTIPKNNTNPDASRYQSAHGQLQGTEVPTSGGAARSAVSSTVQPSTDTSSTTGTAVDSIMSDYVSSISQLNGFEATHESVTAFQNSLNEQYQVPQMQQELMSINTIMNGTEDDIRNEINSAGGFATESQVQGMVYTRNKALVKQATNIENQLSIAQQNVQMAVSSYGADYDQTRQALNDRISGDANILSLQQSMQTKASDMIWKEINSVGYAQFVKNHADNPGYLNNAESVLGYSQGSLSNPNFVSGLETMRERSIGLSAGRYQIYDARFGISSIKSALQTLYPTGKNPIQIYNGSQQVIGRLDAASQRALDPNNPNKGADDLDLVDAYVQIARGGQNITEAQVQTLLSSLGLSAKWDVATQKVTGTGILDDGTRNELDTLGHQILDRQKNLADEGVTNINTQLDDWGLSQFHLNSPADVSGMGSDSSNGTNGYTVNGTHYSLSSDGNYYRDNQ